MDATWHPGSSSTLHLLPSMLIKRSAYLQLRVRDTAQPAPSFFCWVAPEFHRPNPLRTQSVGRAGLQNRRPHSDTCSSVRAIRFLEERLRDCLLLSGDCQRLLLLPRINYFPVDVRGAALRTSSYINCGSLLRATHDVDSCDWSHRCLEHGSLRWVYF